MGPSVFVNQPAIKYPADVDMSGEHYYRIFDLDKNEPVEPVFDFDLEKGRILVHKRDENGVFLATGQEWIEGNFIVQRGPWPQPGE